MHCATHFSHRRHGDGGAVVCEADGVTGPAADGVPPPMPVPTRVAVILLGALAAMLLLYSAITWLGRDGLAQAVAGARPELSPEEAARYVLLSALPYLVVGVGLAVSAWFLPQRRPWARWTGLAASFLLAALMLLGMVSVGGATPVSLLVLVLAAAAVTSLLAHPTVGWVARVGAQR
jgi:peptidoglycan/LPS O-acetylase OafA/YrhL